MQTDVNVVLIGMPGAGKSTVGILLAERLGYGFLDTDTLMQTREGRNLQQIISENGLDGFRRIEENTILSLAVDAHVISTGGSVVYSSRAMAHLRQNGTLCHLDTEPPLLHTRLDNIDTRGIVMAPGQTIKSLYRQRYPLYMQYADITISSGNRTPHQVVENICTALLALEKR